MKRKLIIAVLSTLGLVLMAGAWLLYTESGLRWAYDRAEPYLPEALTIDQLGGSIAGGLEAGSITYRDSTIELAIRQATLAGNPWELLSATAEITRLEIDRIEVRIPAAAPASESANGETDAP